MSKQLQFQIIPYLSYRSRSYQWS